MMKYCFGIDVGGTTVKCGLFSEASELLDKWEIITDKTNAGANIIRDIALTIKNKLEEKDIEVGSIIGVGIGVPGPVSNKSVVNACVNLGWGVIDVRELLMAKLKETCGAAIPVTVENDANVAALGEYAAGGGKGYESLVMVTLGTGVGGGVILDGKIVSGATGAAGEFGHMPVLYDEIDEYCTCGKRGCLEQVASARGIVYISKKRVDVRLIESWANGEELTAKHVFDAMAKGDKEAEAVIEEVCGYLSTARAHITCVINPAVIVIGGGVSKAGDVLISRLLKYHREKAFNPCKDTAIVLAVLGNDAGIYGAAKMCL